MFFVQPNWPGGLYASPSIAGSRPGGVIACCWAALVSTGQEEYIRKSKAIWETAQQIKEGIKAIPGLELLGDSYSTVVAFTSSKVDIFKLNDAMSSKGWHLNALQKPTAIHICCTYKTVGMAETFLKDVTDSLAIVQANPQSFPDGTAAIYGMTASFPDRTTIGEMALSYLDAVLDAQKQ
jgi:sphinganine-1-phosphate aldolase